MPRIEYKSSWIALRFQPERNVHEVHSSCQRVVRDASPPRQRNGGNQSEVFKHPRPRAQPSHHLWPKVQSLTSDTIPEVTLCTRLWFLLTCPKRIEILAKDLSTERTRRWIVNGNKEQRSWSTLDLLPLNGLWGHQERHEVSGGHFIAGNQSPPCKNSS